MKKKKEEVTRMKNKIRHPEVGLINASLRFGTHIRYYPSYC
jgi:hypothetical protein